MDSVRRDAWTHGANGASRGRGRRFPLGALILRYFAYVLAALLALALAAYVAFGLLVGSGTVLLANYGDTALDETSARLGELTSADADAIDAAVPSAYRWALFSPDGAYAAGDVAAGAVDDARAAAFDGLAIDYETFGMTRYEPVTLADGSVCVLVYQYLPQFASKDLRDALPNPQNLLLGALAVLLALTLVGIAARAARVISRKMEPLADAVRRIEERDLDFEVASSRVREIDDVLAAMDDMRASLKDSLEAQWRGEQAQREQIAALAHDLKTPLTVVRGNVDLLLEGELSGEQRACAADVAEGARQMGTYVSALIDASLGAARRSRRGRRGCGRCSSACERRSRRWRRRAACASFGARARTCPRRCCWTRRWWSGRWRTWRRTPSSTLRPGRRLRWTCGQTSPPAAWR